MVGVTVTDERVRMLVMDPDNHEKTARLARMINGAPLVPEHLIDRIVNERCSGVDLRRREQRPYQIRPLTQPEVEVLQLAATGLSEKEIASRIQRSIWTVKSHLKRVYVVLGAANRTDACCKALRTGLIQ